MNLLNEHITSSGVTDMAYQQSPHSIAWLTRTDGVAPTMTRQIDQKITGWARQKLGGSFGTGDTVIESVAVIPKGEEDQVWFVVKRTIDGSTVRYVEFLETFDFGDDQEDAFYVDCGLTYDSTSTSTITGLSHLEGETVAVLGDGAVQDNQVVASGQITLDVAASVVQVGLPYTSTLKTMTLEGGSATGTAQTKRKRIYRIGIRLYRSLGLKYSDGTGTDRTITFRAPSDEMDEAVELFTGDKIESFDFGHTQSGQIQLKQDQPLPCYILGIYAYLDTQD